MPKPYRDEMERFWERVNKLENGCWVWTACRGKRYGTLYLGTINGKRIDVGVHRFSYELHKGPIPEGLEIDHLCKNTFCVNPEHLEAVTKRENLLRSSSFVAINSRKTHCTRGHLYDAENTYISTVGKRRICKACQRMHALNFYYRVARDRRIKSRAAL